MNNTKNDFICEIVYKIYNREAPNVEDYPQEILKELHKKGIIDGWPKEGGKCIMIRKGNPEIFDNAVKKYLKTK